MRNLVATLTAIAVFIAATTGLYLTADLLDIPTYISEPVIRNWGTWVETESDGYATDFGFGFLALSGMLAVRCHALIMDRFRFDLNRYEMWNYWFMGILLYILASVPIFYLRNL